MRLTKGIEKMIVTIDNVEFQLAQNGDVFVTVKQESGMGWQKMTVKMGDSITSFGNELGFGPLISLLHAAQTHKEENPE